LQVSMVFVDEDNLLLTCSQYGTVYVTLSLIKIS
jgi:hypothetical protein